MGFCGSANRDGCVIFGVLIYAGFACVLKTLELSGVRSELRKGIGWK